ncbi:MAG: biotin transporter BioY [Oscillospiraceae bacterium]|nr:biotin transporter BioY [Oscillospiraceae bacterium]
MKIKTIDLVQIALFAAIIAILSQISIPTPFGVPISLQTFAAALCGYFLGAKKGAAALLVWIAIGAVGVPVFTGFRGGFAVLLGLTGGFIYGFIPLVLLCGVELKHKPLRIALGAAGILACHLCGAVQYALLMGIDLLQSALTVSVPFLIKDMASIAAAYFAAIAIKAAAKRFSASN